MVKARGSRAAADSFAARGDDSAGETREAYLLLTTMPGEQGQMDWGSFGVVDVPGGQRRLSLFVLVLSHSRGMVARFSSTNAWTRSCIAIASVEKFGGAPRQILYDNLKSVVLERVGEHVRFHPSVLEFASHYHFVPRPCAPYRPNEKGIVERMIQYVRGSFFEGRSFTDVDDLNEQLDAWVEQCAHQRAHPRDEERRTVGALLEAERERLLPLPAHAPSTHRMEALRSGKLPYLRFDTNDYSIPHTSPASR